MNTGILFSHKKNEILIHVSTWMDLENIMLSEKKPDTEGQVLYDSTYMRDLEQANSQKQKVEQKLPGAGGREEWGVIVDGYRVFVGDDENILGIDSGDGYKIL